MRRLTTGILALGLTSALGAQQPERPEPIKDNSFFIEEAYNQEAGVVQHISTFAHPRLGGNWAYSFTQEWPMGSIRHQLSVTVPLQQAVEGSESHRGAGDVALNYRYQLAGAQGGRLAVAPRLTMLFPTGSTRYGFGTGAMGMQVNLPVSLELSDRFVTHANAGATYTHAARDAAGDVAATASYNLGQSVIWLATPTLNLMLEAVWASTATVAGAGNAARAETLFLAPGVRWAHNLPHGLQIVPGVAYAIGAGPSRGDQSLFTYLSFEHPF